MTLKEATGIYQLHWVSTAKKKNLNKETSLDLTVILVELKPDLIS